MLSYLQITLLFQTGAININKLTCSFDEAPLKLVHHERPWKHSGR